MFLNAFVHILKLCINYTSLKLHSSSAACVYIDGYKLTCGPHRTEKRNSMEISEKKAHVKSQENEKALSPKHLDCCKTSPSAREINLFSKQRNPGDFSNYNTYK